MKYQAFMRKIMQQLGEYKDIVDRMATFYSAEKEKHKEELRSMEGKYTKSYIAEYEKNWKPSKDYSGVINTAREKYQKIALAYIDQIQKELDSYFQIPVDSGFAATVTAIKALGVTPNNREFDLLQGASGGYWGRRLLNELAVSRTKTEQGAALENGEMKRTEKEAKMPYGGVELPDIEKMYGSLQNVKNSVNMAFKGYCGTNYELKDIVFPIDKVQEDRNTRIAEAYGVQAQKQKLDTMAITEMAGSVKCFDENHSTYTAFSEMMGNLAATMPEPKRKTALTDSDRNLIDTLISSDYPSLAQGEAVKIAKADSRLAEILSLDERYGKAVKEALREVSDNE